jgi:type 1 fimbriae regulatory protein FimB/type 1 fimbriae regulatory protein FimE
VRTREYLTEAEVEALIAACRDNRQPHRDATMILIAFRHGLRASDAVMTADFLESAMEPWDGKRC